MKMEHEEAVYRTDDDLEQFYVKWEMLAPFEFEWTSLASNNSAPFTMETELGEH